jgi:8-oxo-dGTP pyrophosphatase MutT (NUDIX family)
MAAPVLECTQELPLDWQARLRQRLLAHPEHRLEHCRFGGLNANLPLPLREQLRGDLPTPLQAAAVLVPIVQRAAAPTLLLTVRASGLRRHAGQISFPGGRLEADDADPAAGAVRETGEELGIEPGLITPIGFLSDHVVRTGFRVTPVIALVQPHFVLELQSEEVAEAFELPLAFALAAANYRARRRSLREIELEVWELPYGERLIWGATAGILSHLRELLDDESRPHGEGQRTSEVGA